MRVASFAAVASWYVVIINVLLCIVATFGYEAMYFALKVQYNLALGLPCRQIYAPWKGNKLKSKILPWA